MDEGAITSWEECSYDGRPSRADLVVQNSVVLFAKMQATEKVLQVKPEHQDNIWSTGFAALRAGNMVRPEWLAHWLRTPAFNAMKDAHCAGATMKAITNAGIAKLTIPLPSLDEQDSFIGLLDEADALRKHRGQAEARTAQLIPAIFQEMFGDGEAAIGQTWKVADQVCERIVVGHVGPTSHGYTTDGILFLRTQNVRPMRIDLADCQTITTAFHNSLRKSQLKGNDVVIARVGANRGMAAVIPPEIDGANCGNIIVVTPGRSLVPSYFAFLVNSELGQRELLGGSVGSAQGVINTGAVKRWKIPVPSLDQQTEFAARVSEVRALQAVQSTARAKVEALWGSLLGEVFG